MQEAPIPDTTFATKTQKSRAFRTLLKNQSLIDAEFSKKIRQKEFKKSKQSEKYLIIQAVEEPKPAAQDDPES
jgi:hypothetical protein